MNKQERLGRQLITLFAGGGEMLLIDGMPLDDEISVMAGMTLVVELAQTVEPLVWTTTGMENVDTDEAITFIKIPIRQGTVLVARPNLAESQIQEMVEKEDGNEPYH